MSEGTVDDALTKEWLFETVDAGGAPRENVSEGVKDPPPKDESTEVLVGRGLVTPESDEEPPGEVWMVARLYDSDPGKAVDLYPLVEADAVPGAVPVPTGKVPLLYG